MANRLSREKSPYLLQHADNPVDWHPWGEEALALAGREDRPILLSIGYSACHWCHVMERESFQDEATASLMNQAFVNIKVDREERPDLDGIYMRAVQALTGRGGWPLTAFLTPEGKAFHGGTYFPPEPRFGMPSFRQVLVAVRDAFRHRRQDVERGSEELLAAIAQGMLPGGRAHAGNGSAPSDAGGGGLPALLGTTMEQAYQGLRGRFDPAHGGFGPAPKFPQPTTLEFLLRYHRRVGDPEALEMVLSTLRHMAWGGIRDHLGGGFHRYSVDAEWLVPHFEKMLYDNGLLARVYLHAFQVSGDPELRDAATTTLDYILEDLAHPRGGFFSARDADSQGEEGLFYLWTPGEVDAVLGSEMGSLFRASYGISEAGNFEGRSILNRRGPLSRISESQGVPLPELARALGEARRALKEARSHREAPFRDEKVLTGWNSFVLRALSEAGAALGREDYLRAARKNAEFLLDSTGDGFELPRAWKEGPGRISGFLEDYAGLGNALLSLHEATLEPRWLQGARDLAEATVDRFWDASVGAFFDTPRDGERLILRPRDAMDNPTPAGNSLALELLTRVGRVFGEAGWLEMAERALGAELSSVARFPSGFGRLLSVLDTLGAPPLEVVLLGPPVDGATVSLVRAAHSLFTPEKVVLGGEADMLPPLPLLEGRTLRDGRPTAYVCRDLACGPPIVEPRELVRELKGDATPVDGGSEATGG